MRHYNPIPYSSMKILIASLKENISAAIKFEVFWGTDPLGTSRVIEQHKKNLVNTIRDEMHTKIATLDMDDLEFAIVDEK